MSDLSYDDLYSGLTGTSGGKPAPAGQMPWPVTAKPHKRQTSVSEDDIIYAGAPESKPAKTPKATPVSAPTGGASGSPLDPILKDWEFTRGAKQGMYDVLESPAVKALNLPASTIAQPIAQDIASLYGGHADTPEEDTARYTAARNAYDQGPGGFASGAGRVAGQAIASLPLMAGGNELTALGLKGLETAAPAAANFLRGAPGANVLVRGLARATQGAAAGAASTPLTSAASDEDIGTQGLENALTGATIATGLPAAVALGRGAKNALLPFTEKGRNVLAERGATDIVKQFTGGAPVNLNTREIIPGSKPTLAEAAGDAGLSSLQRAIASHNPQPFVARQEENAAARGAIFEAASGTPEQVDRAVRARNAAADHALGQIFTGANAKPADITPVQSAITDILSSPGGNRPAVKNAMAAVQGMLSRDGKPITDPEDLYQSVRKGIADLLDKSDMTTPYGRQAASELIAVRDKLDDSIDASAPGFKKYMADYAASSAPITSMKFLQGLNLTDVKGNITLAKVQSAIRRLDDQLSASGVKPGKATTLAQRQALGDIRDDLLRAQNLTKGMGPGSPTAKNLLDQQKLGLVARNIGPAVPRALGALAGGAIGHQFGTEGSGIGALIGEELGGVVGRRIPDVNALVRGATQTKLEDLLLNPSQNTRLLSGGGTGATNLFPGGIPPHVVPLAVLAKNRLLQRGR